MWRGNGGMCAHLRSELLLLLLRCWPWPTLEPTRTHILVPALLNPAPCVRPTSEQVLFSVHDEAALRRARRFAGALSETAMWRTDGKLTNTSSLRRETSDWA